MKYIKSYNSLNDIEKDMLNEKIKFRDILFYLSLITIGIHGVKFYSSHKIYNSIKNFHEEVTSDENDPTGIDKEKIEDIRKDIINNVKQSDMFNKLGKDYILDSLRVAKIKILEFDDFLLKKKSAGAFIKLGEMEKIIKDAYPNKKLKPSPYNNIIVINRNYIDKMDVSDILTHEIYHYIDMLYGSNGENLSSILNLSKFVDESVIDNKEYVNKKALMLRHGRNITELHEIKVDLSLGSIEDLNYLTDDSEIYVRWKTFKTRLIKKGYINDINSYVNMDIIFNYSSNEKMSIEDLQILLILDLNKINDLDSILMCR